MNLEGNRPRGFRDPLVVVVVVEEASNQEEFIMIGVFSPPLVFVVVVVVVVSGTEIVTRVSFPCGAISTGRCFAVNGLGCARENPRKTTFCDGILD